MSVSSVAAFRNYYAAIGSTQQKNYDLKRLFDRLYHDRYILVTKDGRIANKDVREMHSGFVTKDAKITPIYYEKVGSDCLDIKLRWQDGNDDHIIHIYLIGNPPEVNDENDDCRNNAMQHEHKRLILSPKNTRWKVGLGWGRIIIQTAVRGNLPKKHRVDDSCVDVGLLAREKSRPRLHLSSSYSSKKPPKDKRARAA